MDPLGQAHPIKGSLQVFQQLLWSQIATGWTHLFDGVMDDGHCGRVIVPNAIVNSTPDTSTVPPTEYLYLEHYNACKNCTLCLF